MEETLKFYQDPTKQLNRVFVSVIRDHFPKLRYVNINYVFRTTPKTDDEGMTVIGETRKLNNRERDLYGYDFEITVHERSWEGFSKRMRERVAWHELNHCIVKWSKATGKEPARDKAGRVQISLRRHDIVIKTFYEELVKFGATKWEKMQIEKIMKYVKSKRKIKRRKA